MGDWPRPYHPVLPDHTLDTSRVVDLYVHMVSNTQSLAQWCGGEVAFVSGGPVVVVPGDRPAVERMCGLGDFVARDGDQWHTEVADGLYQRYRPAGGA